MATRAMPNNIEAEMNILGIAFLDKLSLNKICEEVNRDVFYDEKNKLIYDAISEMYKNNIPIDIMTIKDELDKKKKLNAVGGIDYLTEVIDSVVTAANLDYYIQIVKENAVRRNLISTATDIITDSYDEEDVTTLLDNAERNILNTIKTRQTSEFVPIHEVLRRAQEKLEELAKNKNAITGLRTGFYDLDKITAGLHGGEMIILAARPGMGKTAFALNIATNGAMSTDKAIAVFNLEMPAEQLVNRMISAVGQIDSHKLQTGQLQHNDWKRLNEAISRLSNTKIFIDDTAGLTVGATRSKCRKLATSPDGLDLVLIDYLTLIQGTSKNGANRQQEVSDISRSLKTLALELNVPIIALSQLSRSVETREDKRPIMSDLRESGSIEQDADIVAFLYRDDYYNKEARTEDNNSIIEINIAKHRSGPTATIELLFKKNTSTFLNLRKDKNMEGKTIE